MKKCRVAEVNVNMRNEIIWNILINGKMVNIVGSGGTEGSDAERSLYSAYLILDLNTGIDNQKRKWSMNPSANNRLVCERIRTRVAMKGNCNTAEFV